MTRFVAIYLGVAILAVVAAVATWLLAPPANAPVAVASTVLTTVSLALTIRTTMVDRPDMRADITNGYFGISDNVLIEVRLYNRGRRPIKVEEVGWAVTKDKPNRGYPYWSKWSRDKDSLEHPTGSFGRPSRCNGISPEPGREAGPQHRGPQR